MPAAIRMSSSRASPGARRGATPRAVALVLALAAGALALLFLAWALAPHERGVLDVAERAPPAGEGVELPIPGAADETDRDAEESLPDGWRAALDLRDGVRLRGDAHVAGVVLDRESAAPVPGVAIELLPLPPSSRLFFSRMLTVFRADDEVVRRTDPVALVHSDMTGAFQFEGVRRGNWFVGAADEHWILDTPARARLDSRGTGGPLEVWVRPGGRVLGRVVDPSGEPAPRARVVLVPGPGLFLRAIERGELAAHEAEADAEGRFSFPAVAACDGWELSAIAPGRAVSHLSELVVEAGEDTEVVLELRAGGTIEGRILSEPDDPAGEALPLAGASVSIVPRGLRHLRLAKEILLSTYATTGPDGRYVLHGVPGGTVDLVAMAKGHVPGKGPVVRSSDGAWTEAADFPLRSGAIVRGRVRDSGGEPIEGAQVRWMLMELGNMGEDLSFAPMLAQAMAEFDFPRTDAEGRFAAGPFPGSPDHRLTVSQLGFQEQDFDWNPERDGMEIEIVLACGGSVEGVVMDVAEAKPVTSFTIESEARIEVEAEAPGRRNPFTGGMPFEDEAGRFRLLALEPGKVALTVRAEGFADARVEDVEVREGETTRGLIVKLAPGARLRGTILDPDGNPIAGALVLSDRMLTAGPARGLGESDRSDPGFTRMLLGVARFAAELGLAGDGVRASGRDGSFELVGLAGGTHTLFAFHRNWCAGESAPLELADGEVRDGIVIELARGAAVYGRVTDRFGRAVPDATIVAMAPGGPASGGGQRLHQGRTDADGDYVIEPMESGGYFLLLTRGDEALDPSSFFSTLNLGMVSLPPEGRVRYDLVDSSAGACRVFGRVTASGQPVAGGNVSAFSLESDNLLGVDFKVARIDHDGAYEFAGLPPGEHRFQIDGRGHGVRLWIEVPEAPECHLDLALPEGAIEGTVLDASTRAPIPGAALVLAARRGASASGVFARFLERTGGSWRVKSDEAGRFRFERLGEGRYCIWAEGPAGLRYAASDELAFELAPDELRGDVSVELDPAPLLTGFVHDEGGIALAGAVVVARHAERGELAPAKATTDPSGRFEIACSASGLHVLTASADGFAPRSLQASAPEAGAASELDLGLERGIVVRVLVLGSDGRPVGGAVATLVREGAPADEGSADVGRLMEGFFGGKEASDARGRLEVGRHAPGRYSLDVRRGFATHVELSVELPAGESEVELRVTLD